MLTADYRAEYGVKQVAEQLTLALQAFIEAKYHIRDQGTIAERRALLEELGTISQEPFIETTPSYELGKPYSEQRIPKAVSSLFSELSDWKPSIGFYARPYLHQSAAFEAFLSDNSDLLVTTGTGSGKTEVFLFAILGHLIQEGERRHDSFKQRAARALLLYPTNALVSDQVSRLRKLYGDHRLASLFKDRYGRLPTFGMYTSRTPYPGLRKPDKDKQVYDMLQYYSSLESDAEKSELVLDLKFRGKWPAKDLESFCGNEDKPSLLTQPRDRELLTRHEIQHSPPDLLVTNYSMLEYMLMRPIERDIFERTKDWLNADINNEFILVMDEAHMYRGAGGAEVGFLVRRLRARLGIPRDRMRCILTTASVGDNSKDEQIRAFAEALTGSTRSRQGFTIVRGVKESRSASLPGSELEGEILSKFDMPQFFLRAEYPERANESLKVISSELEWQGIPLLLPSTSSLQERTMAEDALRAFLYKQLHGYGAVNLLIEKTSGNAVSFRELSRVLFPKNSESISEKATMSLLALGTYAHEGGRPLFPTRVHFLFRPLPSLFVCLNPFCDARRTAPGEERLLGKLFTDPRAHCSCSKRSRVYELLTHRDCGAAFVRVYGNGPNATFYWHEQGGNVEQLSDPLDETILLLEEPWSPKGSKRTNKVSLEPIWIELTTGRVESLAPEDSSSYRLVYRAGTKSSKNPRASGKEKKRAAAANDSDFSTCPACGKSRAAEKIMDLSTKGEQPFAQLARAQFVLQPSSRPLSRAHPNGGRKLLIFSDGRQKAARLARDLPREVEFDSMRYAVALAVKKLEDCGHSEATLDKLLYTGFVSVCAENYLNFFDSKGKSQERLIKDVERFNKEYDGDLFTAIDMDFGNNNLPIGFKLALLRQLCDPFQSLYSACVAVVSPTGKALKRLQHSLRQYPGLSEQKVIADIASLFINTLLEKDAFDPSLSPNDRRELNPYEKHVERSEISQELVWIQETMKLSDSDFVALWEGLFNNLTGLDNDRGKPYLDPANTRLILALNQSWWYCKDCSLVFDKPFFEACTNSACRSKRIEECGPDHPYMRSRFAFYREPFQALLKDARPLHITAEEHSAQLSHRDLGTLYATTEEFELRFQDVRLGPDKPPIDILSCTTTMEVGIDLGALTAVSMRNVPPQRENYQQRAGRAGRRGSAVSTVMTYAQGGPHDSFYYERPWEMISGPPRDPRIRIDNQTLATRHVHSFMIQSFFHNQLDSFDEGTKEALRKSRTSLFSSLGDVGEFFSEDNAFSFQEFKDWLGIDGNKFKSGFIIDLASEWLPDDILVESHNGNMQSFLTTIIVNFVASLEELRLKFETIKKSEDERAVEQISKKPLLEYFFDAGLFPTYAFPTDVAAFYVFDRDGRSTFIKEKPQQSKDKALSEYAPGRSLVVNKKTYRVGGIYDELNHSTNPGIELFKKSLLLYVRCTVCTYVRLGGALLENEVCPICESTVISKEILDPPGFSPEGGEPLLERDTDQEITYATSAQFPLPLNAEFFDLDLSGKFMQHAFRKNQSLVVVNAGPHGEGFSVCRSCGAAWPGLDEKRALEHQRPFLMDDWRMKKDGVTPSCRGPMNKPLYLGTTFQTDVLIIRIRFEDPFSYSPLHPWLHDGLTTLSESLCMSASLCLDIDPTDLSAGYRLLKSHTDAESLTVDKFAEIYIYDTAAGGAGYAAEVGERLSEILDVASSLLSACPNGCDRSCYKCLRHYANRQTHDRLDRNLGLLLLNYARGGILDEILPIQVQREQLKALQRYLELEGWSTFWLPEVPLEAIPPKNLSGGSTERFSFWTHPCYVSKNCTESRTPSSSSTVLVLNDYIVARDLPTAYKKYVLSKLVKVKQK